MDRGGERMESLPRLGLETINIELLHEMIDLTTRVWVRSLGIAWKGVRHLRPLSRGSTSTHCVLHLNLIKGMFNIAY